MTDSAFPCPACGGPTTYQSFSGGREFWCPACETNGEYPEHGDNLPRATLLRQGEAGATALRAQMDQEMARLRAERITLSEDQRTLVVERRVPGGTRTATYRRQPGTGPCTDEDIARVAAFEPSPMKPGQHNLTRKTVTSFGTLWTHVMLGPPTWWKPKARREKDGTLMAGWLRFAVAVKFDRPKEG